VQAVNRKAIACEERDRGDTAPRRRFTFGIYFYSAAAGETAPAGPGRKP